MSLNFGSLRYNEVNLSSFLKEFCINEVISTTDYLFSEDINSSENKIAKDKVDLL